MGAWSEHEALGLHARRAPLGQAGARVIRGRLPVIGLPNAEFLRHGPPPAYARGRGAVGGAEPWPQVHTGVVRTVARGARATAGL